jgi:hypothetical protein
VNGHRDVSSSERSTTSGGGPGGRNVIAMVGIDNYLHWPSLSNAVSDARGAQTVFHELGFDEITPPLFNEDATGHAIRALVADDLMHHLTPSDSLILFYAGHGGTRTQTLGTETIKTGYLIPVDATNTPNRVSTWIELESWLRKVSLLPAKHILVIIDACYSGIALGPIIKWRDGISYLETPLATLQMRRSRRIITSALDDERALDSGPIHGHSLFTGCLIEGLRGGLIRDSEGLTTGSQIGLYVQRRVRSYPNSRQTPDFGTFDFDDRGEIVFSLKTKRAAEAPGVSNSALFTAAMRRTMPELGAIRLPPGWPYSSSPAPSDEPGPFTPGPLERLSTFPDSNVEDPAVSSNDPAAIRSHVEPLASYETEATLMARSDIIADSAWYVLPTKGQHSPQESSAQDTPQTSQRTGAVTHVRAGTIPIKRNTGRWTILLALLPVGGALALGLVNSGRGSSDDQDVSASSQEATPSGDGEGGSVAGAQISESGEVRRIDGRSDVGVGETGPPPSAEVIKLIETARAAVNDEKWNDALTAAKAALEADPDNGNAQALVDQAQSELGNEQVYKQFARAVQSRDSTRVADLYKRLDPESVYRVKTQADHDRIKADYIKEQQRTAKRLADRGRCKEQERLATDVGKVWYEAARAVQAYTCKQSSETVATAGTTPGTGGETPPGTGGETPPGTGGETASNGNASTPAGATFDSLLEQSSQAAGQGDYAESLRFCEMAMDKKPSDQVAAMTCGIAACRLKNAVKARKFLRRINSETRQVQMRQICLQEKVTDL